MFSFGHIYIYIMPFCWIFLSEKSKVTKSQLATDVRDLKKSVNV